MFQRSFKLFSAGLLAALLLVSMPATSVAQERVPENTIQVQGAGQVTARPDAVNLSIGVETEAKTLEEARNQNAQKMSRVTQSLKALNIPNLVLKTSYFSVYPLRKNERQAPVGYRASNNLDVKLEGVTDSDRLARYASQIMDMAMAAGANHVNGPNFYLSETNVATQDALKLAVQQARRTAQTIAEAAGVTITGVYTIETYTQGPPMKASGMVRMAEAGADMATPTPVEPGEFDVTANVTIRFDFRD